MRPFIAAIDFDGTIVEHEFPDIGDPVPGAFKWLYRFQQAGARLILWTMRSDGRTGEGPENGPVLTQAVQFCAERGITFWGVNENPEQHTWTQSPKVYAHRYIDDANAGCPLVQPRGIGRPFVDWEKVGPQVLAEIKAHNESERRRADESQHASRCSHPSGSADNAAPAETCAAPV